MSRSDPTERDLPTERGVVAARPDLGGGASTPSFASPGAAWRPAIRAGQVSAPGPTRIGPRIFDWGSRTFVMGVVNVTPDSFSGDGLLAGRPGTAGFVDSALALAHRMVDEGADLLDVGGESSRPGHAVVDAAEESRRVLPVVGAIHAALPDVPISIDTTKPSVARAALEAGAALLNDVWGVAPDRALVRLAVETGAPIVLMHNRAEARYDDVVGEVVAELRAAVADALAAGVDETAILIDPGFGFGKTPVHNLELLDRLERLREIGRPILLGTSRKSTLGRVLDLPAEERLEATIATTALAVRAGIDIVRVHDVGPNVRAARMIDAVVRGWEPGA